MASEDAPAPEPGASDGDRSTPSERSNKWYRDPRVVIALREIAALKTEKTIVLALVIQLFVAAFSSFLVVGLVSLYSPSSTAEYQPVFAVTGNASDELRRAARSAEEGQVNFRTYESRRAAMAAFDRSADVRNPDERVGAVLEANWTANGTVRVIATAPRESLRTTLTVVKIKTYLEEFERLLRDRFAAEGRLDTAPLPVPEQPDQSNPYFGFSYTVLIPLLMFLPVFISGSIAVDSLTEEVQRGTLELLRSAPITLSTIVDAKVLSTATLAPIQAALWILLLGLNGTRIEHWPALVGIVAGLAVTVVALAVGVSFFTPDRRQAQFIYSTGMLALAVLGVLLPEHPANTVAKLAIGSDTATTWAMAGLYVAVGVVAYLLIRVGVRTVDAEGL